MVFTGTLANVNAALATVTYRGNVEFSGSDTLSITVDDQGNTGAGGILSDNDTVGITVNAVNDGPSLSVPGGQSVNEDTDLDIAGISIADVDVAGGNVAAASAIQAIHERTGDYVRLVETALEAGVRVRCHLEDITRADIDGFVLPFAAELMKLSEEYDKPVKIRLCDTLGFGVPWAGVALPRSVPKLIHGLRQIGVPAEWLEWHGHNDFHKVEVAAATAWLYGCCAANCAIFGNGERTGNPPLEALVVEHAQLKGMVDGVNYAAITELAEYAEKELGLEIPTNYPLVGRDFNVTRAGIHADGLLKNEEIYNCFDTRKLLSRPIGVAITDKTGAAGIKHWIEARFEATIPKHDPRIARVKDRIDAEYAADRVSTISDEEMFEWVRQAFGDDLPKEKPNIRH